MPDPTEQRKLAAIMFTDMVGYTALSQRDDKLRLQLVGSAFGDLALVGHPCDGGLSILYLEDARKARISRR